MTTVKNSSKKVSEKINPVIPEKKIIVPEMTAAKRKSAANKEYKNFTGSIFNVLNYIQKCKEVNHVTLCKMKGIVVKDITIKMILDGYTLKEQYFTDKLTGEVIAPRTIHNYSNAMNAIVRELKK